MTGFRAFVDAASRYYTARFEEHGADPAGVDWRDRDSQELRFDQLLKIAGAERACSINDYGCGYGALAGWLSERGFRGAYTGLDVSAPMLDHARETFAGREDVAFVHAPEALPVADYTVASGVFNVKLNASMPEWTDYAVDTIRDMWAHSRSGIAFNMLTSYSDPERMRDDLYYADPTFFFDLSKRELSRHVTLLHDYGLWEFTLLVRREPSR